MSSSTCKYRENMPVDFLVPFVHVKRQIMFLSNFMFTKNSCLVVKNLKYTMKYMYYSYDSGVNSKFEPVIIKEWIYYNCNASDL